MPHLLIAGKLHPSGLAILDAAPDVTYDYVEEISEPSYAPLIARADGLVLRTQPMTAPTIDAAERLKVVSRHGVGYDAVDVATLNRRGIALTIVEDVNSVSVAEHAMMMLLACAKRLLRADHAVRSSTDWHWRNRLEAGELAGKHLVVLGYGRIGRRVAAMAAAFDMRIRAYDPWLLQHGWPTGGVEAIADLGEALAWADAVAVCVPKEDKPLLGATELAALKPGAIVVNTSRGGIVDESALAAALASGRVGAAGLDVFDTEPPAADHPLFAFDQVILSPHIAGVTAEAGERMAVSSVRNAIGFFTGDIDPDLIVNRQYIQR